MELQQIFLSLLDKHHVKGLQALGFGRDQAERFLPEAASDLYQQISTRGVGTQHMPNTLGGLLNGVDIKGLASRTRIEPGMVRNGLSALLPSVMEFLHGRTDLGELMPTVAAANQDLHQRRRLIRLN